MIGVAVGQPLDETYTAILGFCLLIGVIMVYVRRQATLPPDTVIGVFMAFTLGLGICLLVAATRRFNIHQIEAVMFGSVLDDHRSRSAARDGARHAGRRRGRVRV